MAAIGRVDYVAELRTVSGSSSGSGRSSDGLRGATAVQQDVGFAVMNAVCNAVYRGLSDVEWYLQCMGL